MLRHLSLVLPLLLGSAAIADELVPPTVAPMALVCVEAPGTSFLRPCEPWCKEHAATEVLRLYRQADGSTIWKGATCEEYLAEQEEA